MSSMAIMRRTCDRCRKVEDFLDQSDFEEAAALQEQRSKRWIEVPLDRDESEFVDLCPQCAHDFQIWLKDGK